MDTFSDDAMLDSRCPITHLQAHLILYGDTIFEQLANEHRGILEDELLSRYNTLSFGIQGKRLLGLRLKVP